jgi:apolipoprotein D and lipocalin family protein
MERKALMVLATVLLVSMVSCTTSNGGEEQLETVPSLSIPQYMGRWYEIARYDHSFEKNLVGSIADYTLRPDGKVAVVNSGFKKNLEGKYTQVKAVARRPDEAAPGRLKVKFFGLFSGDYLVFGLDQENYSWALVGSDSRKYLWFLSRKAEISPELFEEMKGLATAAGYDISLLLSVPQKERE